MITVQETLSSSFSSNRILFIVSHRFESVGGHVLSAISIAKALAAHGCQVGLLMHPLDVFELHRGGFKIHFCPYRLSALGPLYRSVDILRIVKHYRYNVVVAMDWRAVYQAGLMALLYRPFLIQVLAGGQARAFPPLRLPGIIVFSEELFSSLQSGQGVPKSYLVLSPGRVDFAQSQRESQACQQPDNREHTRSIRRILAISRLPEGKARAIETLFEQVSNVAQHQPIELIIIGDGDARNRLEMLAQHIMAETTYPAQIQFLGAQRVTARDVVEADIVVGQGRTVIEAVAWGVPAAVCGADGYLGLLTHKTLPELARTNLTGRGIEWRSNLLTDLQTLSDYKLREFPIVHDVCCAMYGIDRATEGIALALAQIGKASGGNPVSRLNLAKAYMAQALRILMYRFCGSVGQTDTCQGKRVSR